MALLGKRMELSSTSIRHFRNKKGTSIELTFAKTSGTVTRDRDKKLGNS